MCSRLIQIYLLYSSGALVVFSSSKRVFPLFRHSITSRLSYARCSQCSMWNFYMHVECATCIFADTFAICVCEHTILLTQEQYLCGLPYILQASTEHTTSQWCEYGRVALRWWNVRWQYTPGTWQKPLRRKMIKQPNEMK